MPEKKPSAVQRRVVRSVPVTLEFDGRKRIFQLSFDFNTLARLEDKTKIKMLNIFTIWVEMSASVLGAMFWAAAVGSHPEYDSDEGLVAMRSYLDADNVDTVSDALWEAYMLFLPKEKRERMEAARAAALKAAEAGAPAGAEENPPTPATPTEAAPAQPSGSSSGPSPDSTLPSASANSAS
jgi:hypothetical protein